MTLATVSAISRSERRTSSAPVTGCAEYGGQVTREPGPMKHGTTVIAFVKDPDGYTIEFIER